MKTLIAIDNFVTENIYQKIVDASQKQPSWWVIQSAIAMLLIQVFRAYFTESFVQLLFTAIYVFCVCVYADDMVGNVTEADTFGKVLGTVLIITRFFIELNTVNVLGIISDLVFVSLVYFSTCKPPAPPKKKFSVQPSLQH